MEVRWRSSDDDPGPRGDDGDRGRPGRATTIAAGRAARRRSRQAGPRDDDPGPRDGGRGGHLRYRRARAASTTARSVGRCP